MLNDECLWMLNADRTTPASLTNDFKKAIKGKVSAKDKKMLKTAKSKVLEQTKPYLHKILSESIHSRDLSKLKAALKEVSVSTQEDICQVDISSDQNLNYTLEKAKDLIVTLAASGKMKSAIMSLKQPTISEIRSYSQPPAAMVMQTTLILLEDKKKIKVCYISN